MRYALYFTPARGSALDEAGARWLGRDARTGAALPQPEVDAIAPERFAALTAEARRYGWHATLKPPFALEPGFREADLRGFLHDFAGTHSARAASLAVSRVGDFVALVPTDHTVDLSRFAGECVTAFDRFRAPAPADEIARRRLAGLTPRQDELLVAWGYPYVFDEFRFHMTLSARVFGAEAERVEAAARAHFAGLLDEPVAIDTVALFAETEPGGPFRILDAARLLDA